MVETLRQRQMGRIARTLALWLNDLEDSIVRDETKSCDKNGVFLDDELLEKENNQENGNDDVGRFFDCNVCLDLANDPIVTCCGHLFCWTCIYKWIHIHSVSRECPVCKGQVTLNDVIPIYGRGKCVTKHSVDDMNLKIPNRPQAKRFIESARQVTQRSDRNAQIVETIRRRSTNRRLYHTQIRPQNTDAPNESPERSSQALNQFRRFRAIHVERIREMSRENVFDDSTQRSPANSEAGESSQIPTVSSQALNQFRRFRAISENRIREMSRENVFDDLTQRNPANSEAGESNQIPTVYRHRINSNLNLPVVSSNMPTLIPADRYLELLSTLQNNTHETNRERAQGGTDDRDSMSSIAAVIQSDTTLENDSSTVLYSSSSSRRRNIRPRASDVIPEDSYSDSLALMRRRLRPYVIPVDSDSDSLAPTRRCLRPDVIPEDLDSDSLAPTRRRLRPDVIPEDSDSDSDSLALTRRRLRPDVIPEDLDSYSLAPTRRRLRPNVIPEDSELDSLAPTRRRLRP